MDGKSHVHLVFVKQCEVPFYHKAWPNHVIVGLPVSCDREGLGAARYYIKVCLHHHQIFPKDYI